MGVSSAALSREREDHAAAEEAWDLEKDSLESLLARAITIARKRGIGRSLFSYLVKNESNSTKPSAPLE